MSINERFFKLLSDKKCSQKQFSQDTGVSEKTISAWKLRKSDPPANLISTIADYFGVSLAYLLNGNDESCNNDVQTKQLLDFYNELTDTEQQIILHKTAEMYFMRVREAEMDMNKKIPMIDHKQKSDAG